MPKKKDSGNIRLSPNLPLIPGNSVTFIADGGDGPFTAKLERSWAEDWTGDISGNTDQAAITVLLERAGIVTVTFYDDGHSFARGTFLVGEQV